MTTYVLMAGLPGTGKSTLAEALAKELNGVVLNKDILRAAIFPGGLTDYSREQDDLVFDFVLRAAEYLARHHRSGYIFLDGRPFSRREQIEQVLRSAEAAGCGWRILHTICPDEIAEARLVDDATQHPAANRTVAMYRAVKASFEPIVHPHVGIDTSSSLQDSVRQVLSSLHRDSGAML